MHLNKKNQKKKLGDTNRSQQYCNHNFASYSVYSFNIFSVICRPSKIFLFRCFHIDQQIERKQTAHCFFSIPALPALQNKLVHVPCTVFSTYMRCTPRIEAILSHKLTAFGQQKNICKTDSTMPESHVTQKGVTLKPFLAIIS